MIFKKDPLYLKILEFLYDNELTVYHSDRLVEHFKNEKLKDIRNQLKYLEEDRQVAVDNRIEKVKNPDGYWWNNFKAAVF